MEARDYMGKGRNIQKALDIIYELNTVLNMEDGGEIAANLRSLYNFMTRHLTQANIKCDPRWCARSSPSLKNSIRAGAPSPRRFTGAPFCFFTGMNAVVAAAPAMRVR